MSDCVAVLSAKQRDRLTELEGQIQRGMSSFLRVAQALMEIRDTKLYRASDGSFADYCNRKWGFSDRHARRLIESAEIAAEVEPDRTRASENGNPLTQRAMEELKSVPSTERRATYEAAKREAGDNPVTSSHIKKVVAKRRPPNDGGTPPLESEPAETTRADWQIAADTVDEICREQFAVGQRLRTLLAIEGQEIGSPLFPQYSWSGTIGLINQFIRYLQDGKPVGVDAKGKIITKLDRVKADALAKR